jgi:hypothetical protein
VLNLLSEILLTSHLSFNLDMKRATPSPAPVGSGGHNAVFRAAVFGFLLAEAHQSAEAQKKSSEAPSIR